MPFVSVTRITRYDFLSMSVSFNPAVSGISRSQNPNRQFNEWNAETISQRPTHAKFYDALVAWAPKFAQAVQRASEGDESLSSTDYGEPTLPAKP